MPTSLSLETFEDYRRFFGFQRLNFKANNKHLIHINPINGSTYDVQITAGCPFLVRIKKDSKKEMNSREEAL